MYEGGLRYHAYRAGKYAFPNDETEQNRDDMKHTMTLMLCRGAYFYAPVEEALERGGEVLDLGEFSCLFSLSLFSFLSCLFFFWFLFFGVVFCYIHLAVGGWVGVGGELDSCKVGRGLVGVRGGVRGRG